MGATIEQILEVNLYPFTVKQVSNRSDVEDIMQDAYINAIIRREQFHEGTNIRSWMFTIVKNIIINKYRKSQSLKNVKVENPNIKHSLNEGINNLEREYVDNFYKSNNVKEVFILRTEGFSYDEISKITGVKLGTVRSIIHRERKRLKKIVKL